MTAPLLSIESLDLDIVDAPILRDVSLSVDAGEVHGIVGESGSGKSMTALSVMQLLPRAASANGAITFAGKDLLATSEADMCHIRGRQIGMVFQEPMSALNPVKTIGQQVSEGIRWHTGASRADADQQARAVLDRVGLPPARYAPERFPHQLSGGQRQRVVIAMAVALDPKLVIADEPTTALDVTIQAQILDLLRDLVDDKGMGLILISHDLAVVADMADRISIMKDGRVIEAGETVQLFSQMKHPYSKMLLTASTHIPDRAAAANSDAAPILDVRDVVKTYRQPRLSFLRPAPRLTAVDGVSLTINPGESVGLVGESGCGKSTLARIILALDTPDSGTVNLDGGNLFAMDADTLHDKRQAMQVVFQDPYDSFNPRHRVDRLVAEPLHLADPPLSPGEQRDRVAIALESVGLEADAMRRYPHEFSGGQRQRIAIARALITAPRLIIADEPVSALDVSIRAQILDLFADLQDRFGLSYLFISHDLTVVRAITDRVLVMNNGRFVEEGETSTVFDYPQHEYTKTLLAAAPNLARTLERRAGERRFQME